jgi:hypothetical protein
MSKFVCPHNDDTLIDGRCCITECPYHIINVSEFFNLSVEENEKTDCVYYDSDIMSNVGDKTQISALSRDSRRLTTRTIKSMYKEGLVRIKSLHLLTHSAPEHSKCCKACGYPQVDDKCTSSTLCSARNEWVTFILNSYSLNPVLNKKQIAWDLLIQGKLQAEKSSLENGINLCNKKHITSNSYETTVK